MKNIDYSRDELLTTFGKTTLNDRYLMNGESYQDLFWRVASYYANDNEHANRMYDYISKLWFMPATPILSNGGTARGLPISCNLNQVEDTIDSILNTNLENGFLSRNGAGIATDFSKVRSIGEKITNNGTSSGIIPFIKTLDSQSVAISQGGTRGGAMATYLHISHPEIEEFIDIRRPVGDQNRRCLNIHHGVVISNAFMEAVENNGEWELKEINTTKTINKISARELWVKILNARVETGEPYIVFEDHANDVKNGYPELFKLLNLKVEHSNLCSEIMLPTHRDYNGIKRTAICCLSSLNLEKYLEWENNEQFLKDVLYFLDNVLNDYIKKAPEQLKNAVYSAKQSRTIGLGVMGFHSFLQSQMVSFEGVMAKSWNKRIFKYIKDTCDKFNVEIAEERGEPEDVIYARQEGIYNGKKTRFLTMLAVAPTASISNICGESSPGIEPYAANVFTQKTKSGSFIVRNKNLLKLVQEKNKDTLEIWSSIATQNGSVQHLDFLTDLEKSVFKTSFEIDQMWVIEHSADRTPFICQGQSVNLFFLGNVSKSILNKVHFAAWKKGLKSLYYCRSRSIQRADQISNPVLNQPIKINIIKQDVNNQEECLACQ